MGLGCGRPGGERRVTPKGIVVVEGVCALHRMFRDAYDVRVWVEAPYATRLARGVERDGEVARADVGRALDADGGCLRRARRPRRLRPRRDRRLVSRRSPSGTIETMGPSIRRRSPTCVSSPSTVLAGAALFFALGGSAVAVTEAVRPQAAASPAPSAATSSSAETPPRAWPTCPTRSRAGKPEIGARVQLRRRGAPGASCERRRVRVRFPGTTAQVAAASSLAAETTVGYLGGGVFRISLWVPGRQDAVDTSFTVLAV